MSQRRKKTRSRVREINRERDKARRRSNYVKAILGCSKNGEGLRRRLKTESIDEILRVLSVIGSESRAWRKRMPGGFPETHRAISNTLGMPYGGTLESELTWELCILSMFSTRIDEFLTRRTAVECAILLGKYESAHEMLDEIIRTHGYSLWAINVAILIAQYAHGLAANRKSVEFLGRDPENRNVLICASFYSQRVDQNVSSANYDQVTQEFLGPYSNDHELAAMVAFFWLELNFATFRQDHLLGEALYRGSVLPVIDRYNAFVRVLQRIVSLKTARFSTRLQPLLRKAIKIFGDTRLHMVSCLVEPDNQISPSEIGACLASITHHYTLGQYEQSLGMAEDALLNHADCFEFYELYAKSLLHLGRDMHNPFPQICICHDVLESAFSVLAKNADTPRSLEFLRKTSYALDGMRFGNQVLAFFLEHKSTHTPIEARVYGAVNGVAPTGRFATCFSSATDGLTYLARLSERYPENKSIELFKNILEVRGAETLGSLPEGVPLARQLKYRALARLEHGDYRGAILEYQALQEQLTEAHAFHEDVVRGLFTSYSHVDMHTECVHLVVDTYLVNKHLLSAVDMTALSHLLKAQDGDRSDADICWPILYGILHSEGLLAVDLWSVYEKYDAFLISYGVEKPSDLLARSGDFAKQQFIYFLRHVCIPQVMDNSVNAFESSRKLGDERIALCQWLLQSDPIYGDCYSREIHELMRERTIRESIQHVDRSKVHIDTGGIAKSLGTLHKEKFVQCLALASIDGYLRQTPDLHSLTSGKQVVILTDMGFKIFVSLFEEIKRRFIFSNEYGLDSYISVRVRHGTLSGQIRSQFENEHLITRLNVETGSYDQNAYWVDSTFGHLSDTISERASSLLMAFSAQVDAIIDVVKNKWLQIKGQQNEYAGLFDFDYSETELMELWIKLFTYDRVTSYDSFVEAVFSELRHRTERNLQEVKTRIRGDLRERLTKALDTLSTSIGSLDSSLRHSDFSTAVTRCRTRIQNELEIIACWFDNIEQGSFPDFDFVRVVDTTTEMVQKCYPSQNIAPNYDIRGMLRCRGETFTSFIDMMFIVMENVARHSSPDVDNALSPTVMAWVNGDRFEVEVTSRIPNSVDIGDLRGRLERLNSRGAPVVTDRFVRTEGGSGYYKLHKIIKHDLKCDEYDVTFATEEDARFVARIEMQIRGVMV